MKLTLSDLYESREALDRLAGEKLPGRFAYLVARNLRVIGPEIAEVERQRAAIVEKYGTPTDTPGSWNIPQDKLEPYIAEVDELFRTEIELELTPIRLSDLPDDLSMTPADMAALSYLIVEGE